MKAKEVQNPTVNRTKEPVKAGPKVTPIEKAKEKPFTVFAVDLILKGGTWEQLIEKGQAEAQRRGLTGKFNKAYVKTLIKYKSTRNPLNLGKLKLTDEGIM
jgi:hypothetical protein